METSSRFDGIESVVRDPVRFKYKLNVSEDAFESLRLRKYLLDAIDAGNGAVAGFGVAKSSLVASTFFAPSGFLGAIGIGTAATPLGWAIAAGVVGAGLSLVVGRKFVRSGVQTARIVPDFINTPMDVLAVGLFDLIGMLGVKIAVVDGEFDDRERERIRCYFIDEWGFDAAFVDAGLAELESAADDHTIKDVAEQLAEFKKRNPDCNYSTMAAEIVDFLNELSEVDGRVDEREEMAIQRVEAIFTEVSDFSISTLVSGTVDTVSGAGRKGVDTAGKAVSKARDQLSRVTRRQDDGGDGA